MSEVMIVYAALCLGSLVLMVWAACCLARLLVRRPVHPHGSSIMFTDRDRLRPLVCAKVLGLGVVIGLVCCFFLVMGSTLWNSSETLRSSGATWGLGLALLLFLAAPFAALTWVNHRLISTARPRISWDWLSIVLSVAVPPLLVVGGLLAVFEWILSKVI